MTRSLLEAPRWLDRDASLATAEQHHLLQALQCSAIMEMRGREGKGEGGKWRGRWKDGDERGSWREGETEGDKGREREGKE